MKKLNLLAKNKEYKKIIKLNTYKIFDFIIKQDIDFSLIVRSIDENLNNENKYIENAVNMGQINVYSKYTKNIKYDEDNIHFKIFLENQNKIIELKIDYLDIYQIIHENEILHINVIPLFESIESSEGNKEEEEENEEIGESMDILMSINDNYKFFKQK